MRGAWIGIALGLLAGCGRLGFSLLGDDTVGDDALGDDSGGDDTPGDAGPIGMLGDPNGYWRVDQLRRFSDGQLLVRGDPTLGIRGEVRIDTTQSFFRYMEMINGNAALPLWAFEYPFSATADTWRIDYFFDGTYTAFGVNWIEADTIDLTYEAGASNAQLVQGDFMRLVRIQPPTEALSDFTSLDRFAWSGMPEAAPYQCHQHPSGGARTFSISMGFDMYLNLSASSTTYVYAGADCTGLPTVLSDDTMYGFFELEGDNYEWYAQWDDAGMISTTGTFTATATEARFERTSCTPQAACNETPEILIFGR